MLLIAYLQDLRWLSDLFGSPLGVTTIAAATCLIVVVAYAFHASRPWLLRLAMGAQACCVLFGFFAGQFPVLLRTRAGDLTYQQLAAPASTLRGLLWAVGIGLLLIAPALTYLIVVYKRAGGPAEDLHD